MPAPEIYIDTSVIGGYFDDEFKAETHRLWELEKKGLYRFVTSVVTIEEISAAPARVKQHFAGTFEADMILRGSEEADELAEFYMSRQIVPTKQPVGLRRKPLPSLNKVRLKHCQSQLNSYVRL